MLCIKTDLEDKNWLIYILEEFKRINQANFEIVVVGLDNSKDFDNVLYYTKTFLHENSLVNKSDVLPKGIIKILSQEIFILDSTDTPDNRFILNYDVFWNSFVFLSRLEEYLAENNGNIIHSNSLKHPRIDKISFRIPIVNYLFNLLESLLKDIFPHLEFGNNNSHTLELSHDVDYLDKTLQLKIKNVLRSLTKARLPRFIFSNSSYWLFDYWEELENKFNKKSVFYIYAKARPRNVKAWFLDPSYDLLNNSKLRDKLVELIENGFEVGLHGSFYSSVDRVLIRKEKEILESTVNHNIDKVRQHWFEYRENITPYLHNELFKFDSTLGWNDSLGFRSGCACRYRPYDYKNKRAFNFFETPQIIMDQNIYYSSNPKASATLAVNILTGLKKLKNAHISISWHLRTASSDYNWQYLYENILKNVNC